ncbi:MAG: T9SS type A sorting domain-containing protein, partial [Ignavibacteria bacterium]|nr:T9SS type A sorting domain-containing protein [Ignavibacteria bacterium]
RISEVFNSHLGWPNQEKMGDYFHLISDDNGASLAWAGTFNGEQDVYFTRIDVDITSNNELNNREMIMLTAYPNPSNGSTLVSYEINQRTSVELSIFDLFGKEVQLIEQGIKVAGAYSVQLNTNELPSGIYLCRLKGTTATKSIRLLVE